MLDLTKCEPVWPRIISPEEYWWCLLGLFTLYKVTPPHPPTLLSRPVLSPRTQTIFYFLHCSLLSQILSSVQIFLHIGIMFNRHWIITQRTHLEITWLIQHFVCRLYSAKCSACNRIFGKNDFVMRAKTKMFHLDCFRCAACTRHLGKLQHFWL